MRDADCPCTHRQHSCRADAPPLSHHNDTAPCEPGSRAAPESRGECRDGSCTLLSEKTHVYDLANRPWLLPFIADRARDWKTKKFLRSLIGEANRTLPEDRPSFAELLHRIDVFEKSHNFTAAPGEVDSSASFETAAVATTSCAHGRRGRKCRAKSGHH